MALRLRVVHGSEVLIGGSREQALAVAGAAEFLNRGDAALLPVQLAEIGNRLLQRQHGERRNAVAERRPRQIHQIERVHSIDQRLLRMRSKLFMNNLLFSQVRGATATLKMRISVQPNRDSRLTSTSKFTCDS